MGEITPGEPQTDPRDQLVPLIRVPVRQLPEPGPAEIVIIGFRACAFEQPEAAA